MFHLFKFQFTENKNLWLISKEKNSYHHTAFSHALKCPIFVPWIQWHPCSALQKTHNIFFTNISMRKDYDRKNDIWFATLTNMSFPLKSSVRENEEEKSIVVRKFFIATRKEFSIVMYSLIFLFSTRWIYWLVWRIFYQITIEIEIKLVGFALR